MFDDILYFLYAQGLYFIALLLLAKIVLFLVWQSREKKYVHFFYIDNRYIINNSISSPKKIALIKAQNLLCAVIVISIFFWLFLKFLTFKS